MTPEDRKALIYRCQDAVAHLTQMVEVGIRGGRYSVTEYRYQLMINEIALASLTAQPIGRVDRGAATDSNEYPDARVVCLHEHVGWEAFQDGCELFTRPAPAINLAEMVPDEMPTSHIYHGGNGAFNAGKESGWNACRAAMLRNIEEA